MGLISNGTTLLDAGAIDSGVAKGSMTLIKTLTASSSANLSFIHGTSSVVLDNTYPVYKFVLSNIHPQTDDVAFSFNFRDGGSNFDAPKTTTFIDHAHNEAGNDDAFGYGSGRDLAQGTGEQFLIGGGAEIGNDNDQVLSGSLTLYNPSSTTFVKHFIARSIANESRDYMWHSRVAGYANVTAAIDGVRFIMSSGNIDSGTIKLYGIA